MTVNIPSISKVQIPSNAKVASSPTFSPITATGGTINDVTIGSLTYRVHTFTSSGILTVTSAPNNIAPVEYLVVAGGGGGGAPIPGSGSGGGGAGGLLQGAVNLNVSSYVITIGTGGAVGTKGNNSSFATTPSGPYISNSIGGGGSSPGGSGSGSPGPSGNVGFGIPGQGNPGGGGYVLGPTFTDNGGGGGGAGSAGSPGVPPSPTVGWGGNGLPISITGVNQFYAGGGGASGRFGPLGNGGNGGGGASGAAGQVNTGGGGGAAASGGSGIVIIRYRIA